MGVVSLTEPRFANPHRSGVVKVDPGDRQVPVPMQPAQILEPAPTRERHQASSERQGDDDSSRCGVGRHQQSGSQPRYQA